MAKTINTINNANETTKGSKGNTKNQKIFGSNKRHFVIGFKCTEGADASVFIAVGGRRREK